MKNSLAPYLSEETAKELSNIRHFPLHKDGKLHWCFCGTNGEPLSDEARKVLMNSGELLLTVGAYLQKETIREKLVSTIAKCLGVVGHRRSDHINKLPKLPL
jgi:hypothetical protein